MSKHLRDEIRQTKPFSGPEQEAFLSLGRTWAHLEHAFSEVLKPHGITVTQYNVLRILRGAGKGGLCRGDVQGRMITRVPDVTRLLDRLEAQGFVVRERDPADRRFVTTRITGAGLGLLEGLDEPVESLHREHMKGLSETELRTLIRLLGRVRSSVREAEAG